MDSSSSKMVKFGKIHCLTFHVLTFGRCSFPGNQFGTHRTWCYLFYVSACTQILMNSFLQHLLLRKSQHDSKCSVVQASSCVSLWISILPQKALLQSDYEKLKKKENVWAFFLRQQSLHCYVLQQISFGKTIISFNVILKEHKAVCVYRVEKLHITFSYRGEAVCLGILDTNLVVKNTPTEIRTRNHMTHLG